MFAQLEDMEGLDMETKEQDEANNVAGVNVSNVGSRSLASNNFVDKVFVRAPHPSLLEGSKQVETVGLEVAANPSGQGVQ